MAAAKKAAPRRKPKPKPVATGDVEAAVERDLKLIARRDKALAESALAAAARALAREIDNPGNSATSKSMCSRALLENLNRLRELAPEEKGADRLDELAAKRGARIDRRPGA